MSEHGHWHLNGEKEKGPYQYRGCGLDGIYLISGYETKGDGRYGPSVTIKNLEGLHDAIGMYLVERKKLLTGKEIRFLRKQMDLSQSELARLIGCDAQTVARYEKGEHPIPGPSDRLLRMIYRDTKQRGVQVRDILTLLDEMDARNVSKHVFAETPEGGWRALA